jgi:hypothetical protein
VKGDTVAVTVNSIHDELLNSLINRTLVSLDGGAHWLQADDTTLDRPQPGQSERIHRVLV